MDINKVVLLNPPPLIENIILDDMQPPLFQAILSQRLFYTTLDWTLIPTLKNCSLDFQDIRSKIFLGSGKPSQGVEFQ